MNLCWCKTTYKIRFHCERTAHVSIIMLEAITQGIKVYFPQIQSKHSPPARPGGQITKLLKTYFTILIFQHVFSLLTKKTDRQIRVATHQNKKNSLNFPDYSLTTNQFSLTTNNKSLGKKKQTNKQKSQQ